MKIITNSKELQRLTRAARRKGQSIGFVPTMGDLHEGHLSLIRKSKSENDITVLSVFVNPKQFGPDEDLRRYPRDKKKDEKLAKEEKIDIMFYPSEKEMYPTGYLTYVDVEKITGILCGRFRPGHFRGVTTVVAKLLNIVTPDNLYLGQKDAQQAIVIAAMIKDLNIPTKVRILPIVREKGGLALSSRNRYLTARQRKDAEALHQSLLLAKTRIKAGERDTVRMQKTMKDFIQRNGSGQVQYIEFRKLPGLEELAVLNGRVLIALAVHFGTTRLIDNMILRVS